MRNAFKYGLGGSWEFQLRAHAFKRSTSISKPYPHPYSSFLMLHFHLPLTLKGFLLISVCICSRILPACFKVHRACAQCLQNSEKDTGTPGPRVTTIASYHM